MYVPFLLSCEMVVLEVFGVGTYTCIILWKSILCIILTRDEIFR